MENKDWQVAKSFLEDLQRSTGAVVADMDIPEAEHAIEHLLEETGTAALLERQMAKLQSQGVDASSIRERYLHSLGCAATKVACQYNDIATPGDHLYSHVRSRSEHWGALAVQWLTEANSLECGQSSRQSRYFMLGYAYEALGRAEDARESYEKAGVGEDDQTAVQAAKAKAALDAKPKRPDPKPSTGCCIALCSVIALVAAIWEIVHLLVVT